MTLSRDDDCYDFVIDSVISYAMSFLGVPYKWGGNNPLQGGMDCSGFILEVLRAIEYDPGDQTANSLFDHFSGSGQSKKSSVEKGDLIFFGSDSNSIRHVAMAINPMMMIESGGGGRQTRTVEDAAEAGAFVRIRPLSSRSDLFTCYSIKPLIKNMFSRLDSL